MTSTGSLAQHHGRTGRPSIAPAISRRAGSMGEAWLRSRRRGGRRREGVDFLGALELVDHPAVVRIFFGFFVGGGRTLGTCFPGNTRGRARYGGPPIGSFGTLGRQRAAYRFPSFGRRICQLSSSSCFGHRGRLPRQRAGYCPGNAPPASKCVRMRNCSGRDFPDEPEKGPAAAG